MLTNNQEQKHQQHETDNQKQKHQQRVAVEDFHGNFVEPLQKMVVQPQPGLNLTPAPLQGSPSLCLLMLVLFFWCGFIHICHLHRHNSRP